MCTLEIAILMDPVIFLSILVLFYVTGMPLNINVIEI